MRHYILDKFNHPIPCDDLIAFAEWMAEDHNRVVNRTILNEKVEVSTVFLGLDHNHDPEGRGDPILFETMVFGGKEDGLQRRYRTKAEAEVGHMMVVAELRRFTLLEVD